MNSPQRTVYDLLSFRISPLERLVGKALAWRDKLSGKHRYDNYRVEHFDGLTFLVTPSVFNPKVTRSGEFLASLLNSKCISGTHSVLDMGTGSGVCAVFAARHADRVVAVDINPSAVRCAAINALLNGLEQKIQVRQGDLFAPVRNERFDFILFNPPFLRGVPRDDRDRAWRSTDVSERFAAGIRDHLKPGGRALVALSSFGGAHDFLLEFSRRELDVSVLAERRFVNERLMIFQIVPQPST